MTEAGDCARTALFMPDENPMTVIDPGFQDARFQDARTFRAPWSEAIKYAFDTRVSVRSRPLEHLGDRRFERPHRVEGRRLRQRPQFPVLRRQCFELPACARRGDFDEVG